MAARAVAVVPGTVVALWPDGLVQSYEIYGRRHYVDVLEAIASTGGRVVEESVRPAA